MGRRPPSVADKARIARANRTASDLAPIITALRPIAHARRLLGVPSFVRDPNEIASPDGVSDARPNQARPNEGCAGGMGFRERQGSQCQAVGDAPTGSELLAKVGDGMKG
jgi:hypothetical protein